jgi:hypothetical protein
MRRSRAQREAEWSAWWNSLPGAAQRRYLAQVRDALRVLADSDTEGTHGPADNRVHAHRHRHLDGTWRSELHGHDDEEHQAHITPAAAHVRFERGEARQLAAVPGRIYNQATARPMTPEQARSLDEAFGRAAATVERLSGRGRQA